MHVHSLTTGTAGLWKTLLRLATAVSLVLCTPTARSLQGDDKQPMLIEADTVEVDEGKSTSLYIGRVQVDQGTMRLLADQVTVHHRPDRRVRFIIARGNPVSYRQRLDGDQGELQAFARRMDYDADRDELILTEEAVLIQGTDRLASDRIVYDRANARMQASGENRVRIRFSPDERQQPPSQGATESAPKTPTTPTQPPGARSGAATAPRPQDRP